MHEIRRPGVLRGTTLAVFLALVHAVNDAITAILGALLPALQLRFDLGPTMLALLVAVFWIASSVTQPLLGSLAEDIGLRRVAAGGVLLTSLFLSLVGVAPTLGLLFLLVAVGGLGSAALHPVGVTIAGAASPRNAALGVGLFTAGGMLGFALGPLLVLSLVAGYGLGATSLLMVPGVALAAAVLILLPDWQPHGRRPVRDLVDWSLARGPVGWLALAGSLTSIAFVTFTSTVPVWLVREHGYAADAALIGWTLGVFALAAGVGALAGGLLAPRLGRRATVVGALLLALVPLSVVVAAEPGGATFVAATAAAGALLYVPVSIKVVVAQELAPHAPAAAAGMIVGVTSAVAGLLYVGLGALQELIGLEQGMLVGFSMVVPAAAIAGVVLGRVPGASLVPDAARLSAPRRRSSAGRALHS